MTHQLHLSFVRDLIHGKPTVQKEIGPTSHWTISFFFVMPKNFRGDIFAEQLKVPESQNSNSCDRSLEWGSW